MDTGKLEIWANHLLDTGKRNNLIKFKDSKASTVEVLLPDSEALFGKIGSTTSFEVFNPEIADEEDEFYNAEEGAKEEVTAAEPVLMISSGSAEEGSEEEVTAADHVPMILSGSAEEGSGEEMTAAPKDKLNRSEYLEAYSSRIHRANQILLFNSLNNPLTALKKIHKRAKTVIEETGVNVAYMAFGNVSNSV